MIKQYVITQCAKKKYKKINTKINCRFLPQDISIGKKCIIGKKAHLADNISIGNFTYLNCNVLDIIIESNVTIGNFCSIAPGVLIGLGNHYIQTVTTHPILFNDYYLNSFKSGNINQQLEGLADQNQETVIGSDVWIGARANIRRGIKIGNGAIIAADSVVTKDVPDYAIVAGIPARIIRYRFDKEQVEFLSQNHEKCFWNWDDMFLCKNFSVLYDIEKYIDLVKQEVN